VNRLLNNTSIFSAESSAILLALDIISQTSNLKFLILSDSLSCINSIENKDLQNPFIVEILERRHELLSTGVCITFVWVPSHIGYAGNIAADATAKAGLCLQISNSLIPYSDLKPLITSHLYIHLYFTKTLVV
jgi:ribonuclease HI